MGAGRACGRRVAALAWADWAAGTRGAKQHLPPAHPPHHTDGLAARVLWAPPTRSTAAEQRQASSC
eukprot:scaffold106740_cov70-Phaeocystis_antarctica.AAC.6